MAADYYKGHPYSRGYDRPYAGQEAPYEADAGHGHPPDYYAPPPREPAPSSNPSRSHRSGERRSHSAGGGGRPCGRDRYNEYDSSRSGEPRRSRMHHDKRSSRHAHSVSPPSRSPSPLRHRKSIGDHALEALGFTGAIDESRKRDDRRHRRRGSHDRHRYDHDDRHRDSSRGKHRRHRSISSDYRARDPKDKPSKSLQNTITAALTAGVVEAYRVRKEPGEWTGEKGKRIIAAVASAGGAEALLDNGHSAKSGKRHILEATLAGLTTSHLEGHSGGYHKKRRSQSEARGGGISSGTTAALLAAAGKKAFEHYQKRSRDSGRADYSSGDDRPSRPGRSGKKRSKSVSEYLSKGIASLGLDKDPGRDSGRDSGRGHDRDHQRHHSRYRSPSDDEYEYSDRPRRSKRHHDRH